MTPRSEPRPALPVPATIRGSEAIADQVESYRRERHRRLRRVILAERRGPASGEGDDFIRFARIWALRGPATGRGLRPVRHHSQLIRGASQEDRRDLGVRPGN